MTICQGGTFIVDVNQQSSAQGTNPNIKSTRSKRHMHSTKIKIVKREEGWPHSRKRKGKVGGAQVTREQSVPLGRKRFTVSHQDEGLRTDFEKRDQLYSRHLVESKWKKSREEACHADQSRLRILDTKQRKIPKAKNRLSTKLTKTREECSGNIQDTENLSQGIYSTIISEIEKEKSKLEKKELVHSKKSSIVKVSSSQHVKSKRKMENVTTRRRSLENVVESIRTRKISLRDKSRVRKHGTTTKKLESTMLRVVRPKKTHFLHDSHALYSLGQPALLQKVKKPFSDDIDAIKTSEVKKHPEAIQNFNHADLDGNVCGIGEKIQSKETAMALKLANDTSGFVRMTLKAVEDSKNINFKMKPRLSKEKEEDADIHDNPNGVLTKVAIRYKSTLESLAVKKTINVEKMIEELGAIRQASKGNLKKTGNFGKRRIARSRRTNFKKDLNIEPIERDIVVKENSPSNVIKEKKPDMDHIKLGRKSRMSIENQMKKFGLIDKAPQNQELSASGTTKKTKSLVVSGFDRLVSRAGGNKEFESALAQIVSSHEDELRWTKEQEKALQSAYLSTKQVDGDFWHLVSTEVPGRSAKECYNKFYYRCPIPSSAAQAETLKAQAPVLTPPNEIGHLLSLSDSHETKHETRSQVNSPKISRKQTQVEAQKTFRNILGHVDGIEGHKKNSPILENSRVNMVQDIESVLDRVEDEKAVILQSNPMREYDSVALLSHVDEEDSRNHHAKSFFENIVISGVSPSCDKENNQPRNGQESSTKKLGVPRVELILKQVDHGKNLPDNSRPTTTFTTGRKKKIIKTNNVYLHSKDALDFGDTTLDAIQRAKQELRNVFSRTGSRGGSFFDIEVDQIGE